MTCIHCGTTVVELRRRWTGLAVICSPCWERSFAWLLANEPDRGRPWTEAERNQMLRLYKKALA